MVRTVVGVLRGGTSNEYPLSLKTGATMLSALPDDRYDVRDIFIDRAGMWYSRGLPTTPARALSQIDVALSALHGGVGEDGTLQRLFERSGVRYAGSRPLATNLSYHKVRAREAMQAVGIKMPQAVSFSLQNDLTTGDMARAIFERFGPPYVVKPATEGASHGIRIAATIIELPDMLGDVLDAHGVAIVEEFIRGHDATVGILEGFRNEDLYAFPPAHVVAPQGAKIIQNDHHVSSALTIHVPSSFSHSDKARMIELAQSAHRALGLSHYSRADFRLTPRGPYLLEVNATPKLYEGAALPKMLDAVGASVRDYLEHSIQLAQR